MIGCWISIVSAANAQLTAVRVGQYNQQTRLVLAFNKQPQAKLFTLKNPARLVIDLQQTHIKNNLAWPKLKNHKVISNIRSNDSTTPLRLVIDLKKNTDWKNQWLTLKNKPPRLVIDFATPILKPMRKVVAPKQRRDVIIAIDPGHGGKDPGAIGYLKTKEKNVVLQISRELATFLNKQPGIKAILTRRSDVYVGLRQRLRLARKYNADFFIAIHADAFKNRRSHGSSVYALSERGASSEAARWLATKENYSEIGTVDLSNYKDSVLRSVLINLSQTATIGSSLEMGGLLLKALGEIADLHHDKVEQAPFVVLKSPDTPSILVETGFISNRREERLLRSPAYQKRLAKALGRGIKNYFYQHSPIDSWITLYRKATSHTVKKGESLSTIAQRYQVSLQELRKLNQLKNNTLAIGKRLLIPAKKAT